MKRLEIWLAATLLLGTSGALAQGTYSEAVEKQRHCSRMGEMGREAFTKNTIFGRTLKQHVADYKAKKLPDKAMTGIYMVFLVAREDTVTNSQEAYMAAWAHCMDTE